MRLLNGFGKNLVITEENSETVEPTTISCYRRTCAKCKELLPTVVADAINLTDDHIDMLPTGTFLRINTVEVHPVMVRKTPKFPTRERHLAIKRKKSLPIAEAEQRRSPPILSDSNTTAAAAASDKQCKNCENGK